MKKIASIVTIMLAMFAMSGCGGANLAPDVEKALNDETKLYTTSNMHYNISRNAKIIDGTNYSVGILIPVNAEVTYEDINSKQILFIYNGGKVYLRNKPKYTGIDISELAQRYFSTTKTDLSKFTEAEQKAIRASQVVNGMTKKAVLVSLGVPPAHRTPTLEMDEWTYWKTRWSSHIVHFKDGKVVEGPKSDQKSSGGGGFNINIGGGH